MKDYLIRPFPHMQNECFLANIYVELYIPMYIYMYIYRHTVLGALWQELLGLIRLRPGPLPSTRELAGAARDRGFSFDSRLYKWNPLKCVFPKENPFLVDGQAASRGQPVPVYAPGCKRLGPSRGR